MTNLPIFLQSFPPRVAELHDTLESSTVSHFMTVNTRKIKILPLDADGDGGGGGAGGDVADRNWSEWGLKYIEIIGSYVILLFMLTFITIYWCVGLVYMYFYA